MRIFYQLLIILILTVISLGIFNLLKSKLVPFFKNRKLFLFILMFLVLLLPVALNKYFVQNLVFQFVQTTVFVIIFLTYFEILRIAKIEKQKPIVGRPKPKPNRIKKSSK